MDADEDGDGINLRGGMEYHPQNKLALPRGHAWAVGDQAQGGLEIQIRIICRWGGVKGVGDLQMENCWRSGVEKMNRRALGEKRWELVVGRTEK